MAENFGVKINPNVFKMFSDAAKKISSKNSGNSFMDVLSVPVNRTKFADQKYLNTSNILNSPTNMINVFNGNQFAKVDKERTIDTVMKTSEDISDSISHTIGKKINSLKATEDRINKIAASDDIDSLDLVTSIHNLELEFKQFNMYAMKIVDAVKSILYNTQV